MPVITKAQVTFTNGENVLELSGTIAAYYNWRFLDPANPGNHVSNIQTNALDQKHNNFGLGTARLNLAGMYGNKFEYRLEFDMDALGTPSDAADAGNYSPLLNAYLVYKPFRGFSAKFGYAKLPYSANNMAYYPQQPYWHRSQIVSGDIFSRRDLGLTLRQSLLQEHINIYAGIYSGMGEYVLTNITGGGHNDPNGMPEFVGRIDFSTNKYDFNSIYDTRNCARPVVSLGLNGRYVERTQTIAGLSDYDLKIISGTKRIVGLDAAVAYKGFSAQFEIHQLIITPTNGDTSRLQGKATNYFKAGGLFAQLNYYNRKLKSGVYIRYDNFIPNDLIQNNMEQTISFGYNFFLKGFKSMLRTQYLYRLDKKNPVLLYSYDEFRIGWQFMF
ncbi:MAG: porin [Bacteroidia bacterium]